MAKQSWMPPQSFSRRAMLGGATAAALGLTAACNGSDRPGPSGGVTTLVNVEHDDRPSDNAAYAAVYSAFIEQNPTIEIEFTTIPWEQARTKLLTMAQGGGLPHMGRLDSPADYAAANMIIPLDEYLSDEFLASFESTTLERYQAPDSQGTMRQYGVPWFAGTYAIMVNKTLCDSAGIDLPEDWTTEEFTEIARELTDNTDGWGLAMNGAGVGDPVEIFLLAVYAHGGKWVNGDPYSTDPEPLTIGSSETAAGIQWYIDLYQKGYAIPSAPSDNYQQRDANFVSGAAAMAWQGPWNIPATRESFEAGGYELVSMPIPEGPAGRTAIEGGGGAGIFVSAVEDGVTEDAWKWLEFLSSAEGQRIYCSTNGMIPASPSVRTDEFWANDPLYTGFTASLENAPRMFPAWAIGLDSIKDIVIPPLLQAAMNGSISAEDMATQMQEDAAAALENNGVEVPA